MTTMSATAGIFIIKCTRWRIIDVPTIGPFPIFSIFFNFSLAALSLIWTKVNSWILGYSWVSYFFSPGWLWIFMVSLCLFCVLLLFLNKFHFVEVQHLPRSLEMPRLLTASNRLLPKYRKYMLKWFINIKPTFKNLRSMQFLFTKNK